MEFKKERVYSAVNADELKPGDKVIVADTMQGLKYKVRANEGIDILYGITDEGEERRFSVKCETVTTEWHLAYVVEKVENCTNCVYQSRSECLKENKTDILYRCEFYKPKTEQKAYRPFKDTDELIKVFCEKTHSIYDKDDEKLFMPYIWVRNKSDRKVWLITEFDKRILDYLFTNCEFLDGSPCGVEE